MVPGEGIEPSWSCPRGILSPVRLPIPPSRHWNGPEIIIGLSPEDFAMRSILCCLLLASGFVAAQAPDPSAAIVQYDRLDREQFLLQGAKKEGEVAVYTSLIQEDLIALSAAFEKKYGVKVKGWRASSEKGLQRAVTEARANRHDVDIIETNGPELEAMYREKVLQALRSPHLKDLLPPAIAPHGQCVGTRINMFVQTYNTKLVAKDEVPKSYADLANPRWKGR